MSNEPGGEGRSSAGGSRSLMHRRVRDSAGEKTCACGCMCDYLLEVFPPMVD